MNDDDTNPGSRIDLIPLWRFTLNKDDALLVLKALGGRLAESEDSAAEALGDRLTLQRAKVGKEFTKHLDRAANHAEEKQ